MKSGLSLLKGQLIRGSKGAEDGSEDNQNESLSPAPWSRKFSLLTEEMVWVDSPKAWGGVPQGFSSIYFQDQPPSTSELEAILGVTRKALYASRGEKKLISEVAASEWQLHNRLEPRPLGCSWERLSQAHH